VTLIHEIGHSLGLKHPHETSSQADGWVAPLQTEAYDNSWYSVMSYRDYPGDNWGDSPDAHNVGNVDTGVSMYPFTMMKHDIWALQSLYSYNTQTSSNVTPDITDDETYGIGGTGDNTYSITTSSNTGKAMFTIFDTGGTDTLDFSTRDDSSTINLDEIISYIGPIGSTSATDAVIKYDIVDETPTYYSGLIVGVYYANSVENVNAGSGDDIITCNISTNVITCGSGADSVYSIGAGDTVYGGAGDDTFVNPSFSVTLIDGGDGTDDLNFTGLGTLFSWGEYGHDLRNFTDAQLTSVEWIKLTYSGATDLVISKQSILDLEVSPNWDIDEDGDSDAIVWISAASTDRIIKFEDDGWTFFKTEGSWTYYSTDSGDTYFAYAGTDSVNIVWELAGSASPSPSPSAIAYATGDGNLDDSLISTGNENVGPSVAALSQSAFGASASGQGTFDQTSSSDGSSGLTDSAMAAEDNPLGSTGSESFAENITLPDTAPVDGSSFAFSEEDALSLLNELIDLNPSGLIDDESLLLADLSGSISSDQPATAYAVEATDFVADLSAGDHYDGIMHNDILVGMSELG
jgi:hypothetical protein